MDQGDRQRATPAQPAPARLGELRAPGLVCPVRVWPSTPTTAHVLMYQQSRPPATADLHRWLRELSAAGYHRVRTSALGPTAAARVELAGFEPIQELLLLQHDDPRSAPAPAAPTSRLLMHQHGHAGKVDRRAFGDDWALDPVAIDDVCRATPRHRGRTAGGDPFLAYAVTGRDSREGFLQRLAVDPSVQRQGLGRALVLDSLRWLARWRVQRVLVNTPTTNTPAVALYERVGFHALPDRLRVYERVLS